MAKIKAGTYRFNDLLSVPDTPVSADIHFKVPPFTGEWTQEMSDRLLAEDGVYIPKGIYTVTYSYSSMVWYLLDVIVPFLDYRDQIAKVVPYNANAESILSGTAAEVYSVTGGWTSDIGEDNQTITVLEDTEVSEEFYVWFTENSTPVLATVSYNDITIANLVAGQTATLKCAGKKMEGDVIVETHVLEVEGGGAPADPVLQEATFTENGEYLPEAGYDGFSKVTVDVQGGGTSEPIILTPSVTLADTSAMGGDYESGLTVDNGSWTFESYGYTVYGYSLSGCKKLKFSGAFLHNGISSGTVRENILFVKGFKNAGGGVGVVGSTDIEVTPETYDVNSDKPYECVITVPDNADGVYFSCDKGGEPTLEVLEEKSYDEGYADGKADGMEQGYDEGRQAEYDAFWDAFQDYGNPKNYGYAFAYDAFTDETYNPKYPIRCLYSTSMSGSYIFTYSSITNTKVDVICGANHSMSGAFANSKISTIPKFVVLESNNFSKTFQNCTALKNITIEGVIANNISFADSSVLSRESIESIINHLSDTASGKTLTLSKVAADKACAEMELSDTINTSNSAWWAWLISTKSNWTISLV